MITKVCTRCNTEKDVSNFYKGSNGAKYTANCKECRKAAAAAHYHQLSPEDKERITKRQAAPAALRFKQNYVTNAGRANSLFKGARGRAKERGLTFDLDESWVLEKIERGVCEVTNIPFDINTPTGDIRAGRAFSPSLDRTDSSGGYTKDNTKVVVWVYNRAKGVQGHAEVMAMAKALCQNQ